MKGPTILLAIPEDYLGCQSAAEPRNWLGALDDLRNWLIRAERL